MVFLRVGLTLPTQRHRCCSSEPPLVRRHLRRCQTRGVKGKQRGRMASTLAQRLNNQSITTGPRQPVAGVGVFVGGGAGLVERP